MISAEDLPRIPRANFRTEERGGAGEWGGRRAYASGSVARARGQATYVRTSACWTELLSAVRVAAQEPCGPGQQRLDLRHEGGELLVARGTDTRTRRRRHDDRDLGGGHVVELHRHPFAARRHQVHAPAAPKVARGRVPPSTGACAEVLPRIPRAIFRTTADGSREAE